MTKFPIFGPAILVFPAMLFTACDDGLSEPDLQAPASFRDAPRPEGGDIGGRAWAAVPHVRAPLCPTGVTCSTADVNRDGKEDLVRFDQSGVFGPAGRVEVAYSNGWDFGPMRTVAEGFCEDDDSCLVADLDGDRIGDLVRFSREEMMVEAALSQSVGAYAKPVLWAQGLCGVGDTCTAGDVNGDGLVDLVVFNGSVKGHVHVARSTSKGLAAAPTLWAQGFCENGTGQCRVGDLNGDGRADVADLIGGAAPEIRVGISDGKAFAPAPGFWSGKVCPHGATCQLADFTGDRRADVVAYGIDANVPPDSCLGSCGTSASSCWCDDQCQTYGDCCDDYVASCEKGATLAQEIRVWPTLPDLEGFDPDSLVMQTPCGPDQTCWSADVTGDGRADFLTRSDDGTLELFHSQDEVDRVGDDAMRLSLLRSDWERRRQEYAQRERASVIWDAMPPSDNLLTAAPELFDPPAASSPPTPSDPGMPIAPLPDMEPWPQLDPGALSETWYMAQQTAYVTAIEAAADEILDAVPPAGTLVDADEQLHWQESIGKVIAARAAVYAPPLGASAVARGGACSNAILHDRPLDADGVHRVEGSYFARYFDAWREHDASDRVWAALPALTGVVEGMRCLSEEELAGVEQALVEATVKTMDDLLERGQPALAQVAWDQVLPLELLLFDGVKTFTRPQGWRLLQARIESGAVVLPELPEPGADFDAFFIEDESSCETIRCQLYKGPRRELATGQFLTLDTLGVWLPDLTERERLRRSSLYPELLLDAMVDMRLLGEGDCALIELGPFNRTCKSQRTCQMSQQLAAVSLDFGAAPLPGEAGSEFTHFGTARADLPSVNECGAESGGGGSPPSECMGPQLRGHRGRFSPLDPEMDAVMECTLASFTASTPTTSTVAVDLDFDPSCLLTDDPPEDPPADPPATDDAAHADKRELQEALDAAVELLETDTGLARYHGYSREEVISAIVDATGASRAQVLAAMAQVAGGVLSNPASSWTRDGNNTPGSPIETRSIRNDDTGETHAARIGFDGENMDADLAIVADGAPPGLGETLAQEYMVRAVLHEAVHMILTELSNQGLAPSNLNPDREWHHDITATLGLTRATQSCGVDDTQCSTRCGFADARMKRFSDCLNPQSPPFDRCAIAEDYCEGRSLGTLDFLAGPSCGAPSIEFPPLCAAVSCDTSSDLADACCGGTSGEPADPLPYSGFGASPGPHPGDPDGPFAGVPGGPGGVPFPPTPPGM